LRFAGEGADVDVDLVLVVDVDLDGDGDLAWTPKAGTAHTILVSIATTSSSKRSSLVTEIGHEFSQPEHVERRSALHGLSARDFLSVCAVRLRPPTRSLGNVTHDGLRRSSQWIGALRVAAR
jgi:hypothetical protein